MTYLDESRHKEPLATWTRGEYQYVAGTTTTLVPTGQDGYVRVLVEDLTPRARRQYVLCSDPLVNDLAISGPGGLHDNFVLAPLTTYAVRIAWDSLTARRDGTTCLFVIPDGTVITTALMGQLGIGNYDMWSAVLTTFDTDGAGAIVPFPTVTPGGGGGGGAAWTWLDPPVQILTNGVAVAATAVDMTPAGVPANAVLVALRVTSEHNGALELAATFYTYDGVGTEEMLTHAACGANAGNKRLQGDSIVIPQLNTLADSLRYIWTAAPTVGANIWVLGYAVP